jgi:hypothetical protein
MLILCCRKRPCNPDPTVKGIAVTSGYGANAVSRYSTYGFNTCKVARHAEPHCSPRARRHAGGDIQIHQLLVCPKVMRRRS